MSGNEAWNRNVFKRWRKVDRDGADITLSDRLFQNIIMVKNFSRVVSWEVFRKFSSKGFRKFSVIFYRRRPPYDVNTNVNNKKTNKEIVIPSATECT